MAVRTKTKRDAILDSVLTLIDERRTGDARAMLDKLSAGKRVDGDVAEHSRRRARWAFFRRVSEWAHGAVDRELDRLAGLED